MGWEVLDPRETSPLGNLKGASTIAGAVGLVRAYLHVNGYFTVRSTLS